jgi:DNA-binding ferritin-like protein (Dps family)
VEQSSAQSKELVKMTPAELELLIDKIMEETHPSKKKRESMEEQLNKESIF